MKILMLSKLEGVNGVFSPEQCQEGTPKNVNALRLQLEEVNAAVRGAFAGGATRAVVKGLGNPRMAVGIEALDERAEIILGSVPVDTWRAELQEAKFDAIFMLGFHARANAPEAFFPSTLRPQTIYRVTINGHEAGEAEEAAIRYGAQGLPIAMVSGDDTVLAEAREFLGEQPEYVAVKKGNGWMPAITAARKLIEKGAKEAMKRVAGTKPYESDFPLTIRVEYTSSAFLDRYKGSGRRIDATTLELVYQAPEDALQTSREFANGWLLPA